MLGDHSSVLYRESNDKLALSSWVSLMYLALPMAIYLVGWVNPKIAYPLVALLSAVLILPVFRRKITNDFAQLKTQDWGVIVASFAVCASALFCTGITDNWKQTPDFKVRHDILYTLAYAEWPTILQDGKYFVYYFQSFLPGALFAKWVSWEALQWLEYIWLCVGAFLTPVVMFSVFKRWTLLFTLALFGWAGLSFVPDFLVEYVRQTELFAETDMNFGLSYLSYRVSSPLWSLKASPYWVIPLFLIFALSLDSFALRHFGAFIGACVVAYSPMTAIVFLPALLFLYLKCYSAGGQSFIRNWNCFVREQLSATLLVSLAIVVVMGMFYSLTKSDSTLVSTPLPYLPFVLGRFGLMWLFNMGTLVGIYYLSGFKCKEIWFFAILQFLCISLSAFCSYDVAFKGNMVCVWYGMCYLIWAMREAAPKRRNITLAAFALVALYGIYRTPSLCISVGLALFIYCCMMLSRSGRILLTGVVLATVALACFLCPSLCNSVLNNLKGGNLQYSSHIGIYQKDGGSGVWWWYRGFPHADDVPTFLFRK